jgi:predicted cupin superfamily sugar epimerase
MTADECIAGLGLEKHPEGGWFRQTYRAAETLPAEALPSRVAGPRALSTAICFLLRRGEVSALHRLRADEVWHFYAGSPITLHAIAPDGSLSHTTLGRDLSFQAVVPAGHWFGATVEDERPDGFALVGCTVAPGFCYEDFELADPLRLVAQYPQHRELIETLARHRGRV